MSFNTVNVGLPEVGNSTVGFANNFIKVVAEDNPGNLITSALSAQVVLAMAAYGARGSTAEEMKEGLLMPSDDELGQSGYKSLIGILNNLNGVELRLANKIFTSIREPVLREYEEMTAEKFSSASQQVLFDDANGTAEIINNWCEEQTNKRITDVISPDMLYPETTVVLVNAVYFKGEWRCKFKSSLTKDRPFHVDKTRTIDIPTMFMRNNLLFGYLPELCATFLEIPYQGREVSMIIIRPNEIDGLAKVLDNIDKFNPDDSSPGIRQWRDINLYLPKFRIERTFDLKKPMTKLGMANMFQDSANFSGITAANFKIDKIIQKAFIEVNEEGTEAAAVTAVTGIVLTSCSSPPPPIDFRVDRPFYYMICRIYGTRIPLFSGVVYEPSY